jgi:hypothetical protein
LAIEAVKEGSKIATTAASKGNVGSSSCSVDVMTVRTSKRDLSWPSISALAKATRPDAMPGDDLYPPSGIASHPYGGIASAGHCRVVVTTVA